MLSEAQIEQRMALYSYPVPPFVPIRRRKDAEYEALETAKQLYQKNDEARRLLEEWYSWEHSKSLQARTRTFLGGLDG